MSQPPSPYSRLFSFETFSVSNPNQPLPGVQVDNEFNRVAQSLSATISRLNELQRDDGKLRSTALDNTEIINTAKLAAYAATMDMLQSSIDSVINSAANAAQAAEDSSNSAAASEASAQTAAGHATAAGNSASAASNSAILAADSYASATIAANLSTAAKNAAQISATSAQNAASVATGTLNTALSLKTYLDAEHGDLLDSWQNLNDVQNKHQSREHLGIQGDTSHASLYHELKTTLRYGRPPQVTGENDLQNIDQWLERYFGLVFNVTTDQFVLADPQKFTNVLFHHNNPEPMYNYDLQQIPGNEVGFLPQSAPGLNSDNTLEQRVEYLRMKLRNFGTLLTNTMIANADELEGAVIWQTGSGTRYPNGTYNPNVKWTSIYEDGVYLPQGVEFGEYSVEGFYGIRKHITGKQNRLLSFEDFARGMPYTDRFGNQMDLTPIPYVWDYIDLVSSEKFLSYFTPTTHGTEDALQRIQDINAAGNNVSQAYLDSGLNYGYSYTTREEAASIFLDLNPFNRITWRGEYDPETVYSKGDGVTYNGGYYIYRSHPVNGGFLTVNNPGEYSGPEWNDADYNFYENWVNIMPPIPLPDLTEYLTSSAAASTYFPIPTGDATQYVAGDGSLVTFPETGNPFDQSLNTTDNVVFASVSAGDAGSFIVGDASNSVSLTNQGLTVGNSSSYLEVKATGITFPDFTTQTTAGQSFDQSLNTTDSVMFFGLTVLPNADGGLTEYYFKDSEGLQILSPQGGSSTYYSHSGITFPDATVQTTAYTGQNIFDQSLNTSDSPTFQTVTAEAGINVGGLGTAGITFADTTVQTTAGMPIPTGDTTQYIAGDGSLITFPTLATANKLTAVVYNQTGATIAKGQVVYINGAHGNQPTVALAQANSEATSAGTYGFVAADIGNNSSGTIVIAGIAENLDTNAFADGDKVYLSPTVAGGWTTTKPYAPNHMVYLGVVTRAHPTQGIIQLRIANGFELDELHDVQAQSPAHDDGLFYDTADSQWKTKSISTALGYTPAPFVDIQTFGGPTTSGTFTWTKPAGAKLIEVLIIGAGGGGAGGRCNLTTVARQSGGGGGSGSASRLSIHAEQLGSTVTVIIGAGGVGGAGVNVTTIHNPGANGGVTQFGNYRGNGGTGSPGVGVASSGVGTLYQLINVPNGSSGANSSSAAGAASGSFTGGQLIPSGGGGGAGAAANVTTTANGGNAGSRLNSAAPNSYIVTLAGGAGGTNGGNGTVGTNRDYLFACGTGGGGGSYKTGQDTGNGGNGGWPGGGGGGGAAADDGFMSGSGGKGANGSIIVITYF